MLACSIGTKTSDFCKMSHRLLEKIYSQSLYIILLSNLPILLEFILETSKHVNHLNLLVFLSLHAYTALFNILELVYFKIKFISPSLLAFNLNTYMSDIRPITWKIDFVYLFVLIYSPFCNLNSVSIMFCPTIGYWMLAHQKLVEFVLQ